jgi:signal transduction histidine kinase/phage shock protein PspC (stress-responsive transcriptional regulator)
VRPRAGSLLAGVSLGLAQHLGLNVRTVRLVLVGSCAVAGAGLVLYAWLWAFVPSVPAPGMTTADRPTAAQVVGTGRRWRRTNDVLLGAGLVLGGLYVLAWRFGLSLQPGLVLPALVVVIGAGIAYWQLDEVERGRWATRAGVRRSRGAIWRLAGGLALTLIGLLLLVLRDTDVATLGSALLAVVAVLAGTGLVLAPWGLRLWQDLDAERAATAREAERADIAAHLHDSVLQTLALIQRRSGDPAEVARLARAQERDLRGWLYAPARQEYDGVAAAVTAAAAEIEETHGVVVEVVTVGDRVPDERTEALIAATREAVHNAVRHSGASVAVYLECNADGVEAFVRDRGSGFDVNGIPDDRHGVRESIIGRMERHGGSARIRSDAEGTEVRLLLPDPVPARNRGAS